MTRKKHPIVAITGASGAGTTVVQQAFKEIFFRQGTRATFVHGDSFFRYDQGEMCIKIAEAEQQGRSISTYGP